MGLYRFLRSVGFEHEDIEGGLLAEHPAVRLNERQKRLKNTIRKVYERLVRHRRALEELRRDERQEDQFRYLENARLQRHQKAYSQNLQLFARLKEKLNRLRASV